MKNKWDHEVINSQEDEDGFSLNPGGVFHYDNERRKQGINSNKSTANTEPGSAEHALVSPGARRRISQLMLSSSADLQS